MMTKVSALASTIAVLAIGLAGQQWFEHQRAQETITAMSRERDELRVKLETAEKQSAEASQRAAQAKLQATTLREDLGRLFSKENTLALRVAAEEKAKSRFRINAKTRAQLQTAPRRIASVRSLETTYQVLYRQLQWSPEQIERFKAIATADATRFAELDEMAKGKGMNPTSAAMQPLYLKADENFRTKASEHFGGNALPAMQHFAETLFLRDGLLQFANELFWTDTPLTEAQANQLVEILWKNMRDGTGRANHRYANPEAMKSEANAVLSAPQLELWRKYIDYHAETSFVEARTNPLGLRK